MCEKELAQNRAFLLRFAFLLLSLSFLLLFHPPYYRLNLYVSECQMRSKFLLYIAFPRGRIDPLQANLSLPGLTCALEVSKTFQTQNKFFYKLHFAQMGLIIMMLTLLTRDNKYYDLTNPKSMKNMVLPRRPSIMSMKPTF